MYHVYILRSKTTLRFYVGSTQDVANRLMQHNNGGNRSTRSGIPWVVVHVEPFGTRGKAMEREKKIKSRGIGRYLNSLGSE